ncbi:MAG: hypothetical protein KY434_03755 [Actinobacteria bacterium]|nr:hypothetical protein [Actinomycetota bacterium]
MADLRELGSRIQEAVVAYRGALETVVERVDEARGHVRGAGLQQVEQLESEAVFTLREYGEAADEAVRVHLGALLASAGVLADHVREHAGGELPPPVRDALAHVERAR